MNESVPRAQTLESLKKIENHNIKILIAEDDKNLQDFYADILGGTMGYTIEAVKSGEALLEELTKNTYSLVITDNNMIPGGMTGLEVLAQIRENEKLKNLTKLPVIVCSGDDIKKSVEENGAVFLPKYAALDWGKIQITVESVLRDQKIRNILADLYSGPNYLEISEKIAEQDKYLMGKYGEGRINRTAYHALISSTPDQQKHNIQEDFPGEDSIEKFVEALEKKYKK